MVSFRMGSFCMGSFCMGPFCMGPFRMDSFRMGSFRMGSFRMRSFRMDSFRMGVYRRATFGAGSSSGTGLNLIVLFAGIKTSYKSSAVSILTTVLCRIEIELTISMVGFVFSNTPLPSLKIQPELLLFLLSLKLVYSLIMVIHSYG